MNTSTSPKEDAELFTIYMNDLILTITKFFNGSVLEPRNLGGWLQPLLTREGGAARLMHQEPLYTAADFLGIDRDSIPEEKYHEFRRDVIDAVP